MSILLTIFAPLMKMATLKITKNHEKKMKSTQKKLEDFTIVRINDRIYINNHFSFFGTLKKNFF